MKVYVDLINQKRNGLPTAKAAPKTGGNVINLMDALKRSLDNERQSAPPAAKAKGKKPRKRVEGQREMLLPISGKHAKEEPKVQATRKADKPTCSRPIARAAILASRCSFSAPGRIGATALTFPSMRRTWNWPKCWNPSSANSMTNAPRPNCC